MTETQLRQLFKNNSNCYADADDVIQAIDEDGFIDIINKYFQIENNELMKQKLIKEQSDWLFLHTSIDLQKLVDFKETFK